MLFDYLKSEETSIVLLGNFNPSIIQPFWLSSKQLIQESDAKNAKITLIHEQIVQFSLDWVDIEVTYDRFVFKTVQNPHIVKDLAVNVFLLLKETPVKAFGINHLFDFALRDEKLFYEFGNRLSPLNNFNTGMNDPRLLNLEIIEKDRYDGLKGQRRIRIFPSDKLISEHGISIHINNHYIVSSALCKDYIELLVTNWDKSRNDSIEYIEKLWQKLQIAH